jgi:NADH-quinone oxidoreductase subunit M
VRICGALFPAGMLVLAPYLVALATVGTLYGALVATRQRDTRRLIAFSSLSHLNLIGLAAFLGTPAGEQGALLASVSHGLVVAALFLLAAALATRVGGFSFGPGGLAAGAPVLAAFTTIAVVAAIGVPGTSGFAGELLVLASAFTRYPGAAAIATLVVIVAAVYGLGFLRAAFFGPPGATAVELGWRERALLVPLLSLVLAVGVAPRVITDLVPAETAAAPVTVR